MRATLQDVALLAGVNPSTVSRVINGKAAITQETKNRVFDAMKQLEYHPNSVARSLASGLAGAIGVVVDAGDADSFSNMFFSRSLFAIEKVAQERGYHVIIANGGKSAASAIEALVLERKVDGLILPPATVKPSILQKMDGFSYVVLGQPDSARADASWVDNNNEQGAELAVDHLISKGYKRISYIGGSRREGFVKRRMRGYQKRVPNGQIIPTDGSHEDACRAAKESLSSAERPDSFLCNDNIAAFGLLRAAKELGFSIPNELGIVTFDNYPLAEYTDPPLTAVDIDTAQLGEQTARLLFSRIDRSTTQQQILLGAALIERASSDRT